MMEKVLLARIFHKTSNKQVHPSVKSRKNLESITRSKLLEGINKVPRLLERPPGRK